jgi:phosphotransferase system enzyme I (PtsI)
MIVKGIPASPGIAIGKAYLIGSEEFSVMKLKISPSEIPREIVRFEEALMRTRDEIMNIQQHIAKEMGSRHAEIFNAHLLVLEDRTLIEEVITKIKKDKVCVDYVFVKVLAKYVEVISKIDDPYLRERISDINDVGKRILRNLKGVRREKVFQLKEKAIIVAYDISPSDTALMQRDKVIGFVTDIGGRTSHTAIMAKALELPAVVGVETATHKIRTGDTLIVDGNRGEVIINPSRFAVRRSREARQKLQDATRKLANLKDLPAKTLDGHSVELAANIELPEEILAVKAHGAKGIGLYRTEYFYMNRKDLPSEEEHFQAYKKVVEEMAPEAVIIRTLDLGGDKFISQLDVPHEMNPYLGWRAIRFCLARPDIFKVQLRALLRASVYGNLKFMFPMISGVEELRQAKQTLAEAEHELTKKKIPFNKDIEVGAMIEIPSAALTSDLLAKEVDFFSIGTNDLIQYSIAVDRANEKIAYLYRPTHPAVLRLIKNVIDAGHKNGIWVGMCGEMAGEPAFALILLGLGLDEFSTSPLVMPEIKQLIRSVTLKQAQDIVRNVLTLTTAREVEDYSLKKLHELIPEMANRFKSYRNIRPIRAQTESK